MILDKDSNDDGCYDYNDDKNDENGNKTHEHDTYKCLMMIMMFT
jgi:hypothetical protein